MCSSENRTRSVRPGGKYRSIQHTKISEIQTGIFGQMERALSLRFPVFIKNDGVFRNFCPMHFTIFSGFDKEVTPRGNSKGPFI